MLTIHSADSHAHKEFQNRCSRTAAAAAGVRQAIFVVGNLRNTSNEHVLTTLVVSIVSKSIARMFRHQPFDGN